LCLEHDVLKIKTIGDAFMAVCGMLTPSENPVLSCIRCGVDMIEAAHRLPAGWDVRIGIHVGPVVGGLLGRRQFQFDLWGDTVNSAARIERNGEPGKITLSGAAWDKVASLCRGHDRGLIPVKGKGMMRVVRFEEFLQPGR
jgi:class 3 adenylate cyclase